MMFVRVLFDTGSQRSYVMENIAIKVGYKSPGIKNIVHSLFGIKTSRLTITTKHIPNSRKKRMQQENHLKTRL